MKYYPLVEQFIVNAFVNTKHAKDIKHFERTVYWLKQLRPDADEALQIAAFAHDCERAFRDEAVYKSFQISNKGFTDQAHLKHHSETGAKIVADFLQTQHAPMELIERVRQLISKHEVGGNDDENLLKDADSLSYFENQIPFFLEVYVPKVGKEKVKEKFQWMFDRITSEEAKELAKPMFEEAIIKLNV